MLSRKRKFPSSKNPDSDLIEAQRKLQEAQSRLLEMRNKRKQVHLGFGPSAVTNSIYEAQGKRSDAQSMPQVASVPQARFSLGNSAVINNLKTNTTAVVQGKQTEMQTKTNSIYEAQGKRSDAQSMPQVASVPQARFSLGNSA